MKKNTIYLKFILWIFILGVYTFDKGFAQSYTPPAPEDTSGFGKGVQRTMQRLATSNPSNKNTVKILVYGQSISHGTWWLKLREKLQAQFPNANLVMENKAIGGFASQLLSKPFIHDVLPYNYDLVLFHVYGSQWTYDTILRNIRTFNTSEMALQNDQGRKGSDNWADQMSYVNIPNMAKTYRLEMMDVRTPWTKYLDDNKLQANQLTTDGVHLNDHGNYLLGELIARHLAYKPQFPTDPQQTVKIYEVGKDVFFSNARLEMDFEGNRIEVVGNDNPSGAGQVRVEIDGKRPREYPGCFYYTRPNDSTEVPNYYTHAPNSPKRKDWPWAVGSIIRIDGSTTTQEDWTIEVSNLVKRNRTDNSGKNVLADISFDFKLTGSVTGEDGTGRMTFTRNMNNGNFTNDFTPSNTNFVSKSGKIRISPSDWWIPQVLHENAPYKVSFENGFKIRWKAKGNFNDPYMNTGSSNPNIENSTLLAHGFPKGFHKLSLSVIGGGDHSIKYIKVFNPVHNRPLPTSVADVINIDNQVSLYPNPATNLLNIDITQFHQLHPKIFVTNSLGVRIDEFSTANNGNVLSLNTENYQSGMYHLNIELESGEILKKKFSVIK
jgi:hypothetical protein